MSLKRRLSKLFLELFLEPIKGLLRIHSPSHGHRDINTTTPRVPQSPGCPEQVDNTSSTSLGVQDTSSHDYLSPPLIDTLGNTNLGNADEGRECDHPMGDKSPAPPWPTIYELPEEVESTSANTSSLSIHEHPPLTINPADDSGGWIVLSDGPSEQLESTAETGALTSCGRPPQTINPADDLGEGEVLIGRPLEQLESARSLTGHEHPPPTINPTDDSGEGEVLIGGPLEQLESTSPLTCHKRPPPTINPTNDSGEEAALIESPEQLESTPANTVSLMGHEHPLSTISPAEALKESLRVVARIGDAFPPLKTAAGGIVEVFELIDSMGDIQIESEALKEQVIELEALFNPSHSASTAGTQAHLEGLSRALEEQREALEKWFLMDHSCLTHIVLTTKDKLFLMQVVRDIRFSVEATTLGMAVKVDVNGSQLPIFATPGSSPITPPSTLPGPSALHEPERARVRHKRRVRFAYQNIVHEFQGPPPPVLAFGSPTPSHQVLRGPSKGTTPYTRWQKGARAHRYLEMSGVTYDLMDSPSHVTRNHHPIPSRRLLEPATDPPLPLLTITCAYLQRAIIVYASNGSFVQLGDTFDCMYRFLRINLTQQDFEDLSSQREQHRATRAYEQRYRRQRSSREYDAEKRAGMKRIDFLMGHTKFLGISNNGRRPDEWLLNVT